MSIRHIDDNTDRIPGFEALKHLDVSMTDATRSRLARLCREEVSRPPRRSVFAGWLARLAEVRAPLAVAAAGIVAIVAVSFLMTGRNVPAPGTAPEHEVKLVSVRPAARGGVTLEWRDGNHRVYNVLKSTDPRDFSSAARYAVRGTRWTDTTPAPGEVVYYRVE